MLEQANHVLLNKYIQLPSIIEQDPILLLGVSSQFKPTPSPPIKFHNIIKIWWRHVLTNSDFHKNTVASLDTYQAWNFMLEAAKEHAVFKSVPLLQESISARAARNLLKLKIENRRSMIVRTIDNTRILKNCKFVAINRDVKWENGLLTLQTLALMSDCGVKEEIWEKRLNTTFTKKPALWTYKGTIPNTNVSIYRIVANKKIYSTEIYIQTEFLPERIINILPDYSKYKSYILSMWMDSIRKFRYRSILRNNMLL